MIQYYPLDRLATESGSANVLASDPGTIQIQATDLIQLNSGLNDYRILNIPSTPANTRILNIDNLTGKLGYTTSSSLLSNLSRIINSNTTIVTVNQNLTSSHHHQRSPQ